jgi:cbb3-type cytochrome oxidase subunit 3
MVLVRRSELYGIKRGVERAFENPAGSASAWATAWLGVGLTAGLSLGAFYGTESDDKVETWVLAGHWVALVVGLFLATWCWWFDRRGREGRRDAKDDVCAELDELDDRAPTTIEDQAAGSP